MIHILAVLLAFLPTTIQHVETTNTSTLLYCTCTVPQDASAPALQAIGRNTGIVTDEGTFKLLGSMHMPIWDETDAHQAYLTAGRSLNFILEFESFPTDAPFDLIEDESRDDALCIKGIDASALPKASVTPEEFIAGTPYAEYSFKYIEGQKYQYYDDPSLNIAFGTEKSYIVDGKTYQSVGFVITNKGEGAITMGKKDFTLEAYDGEGEKSSLSVLSAKKADEVWHDIDRNELVERKGMSGKSIAASTVATTGIFVPVAGAMFVGLGIGAAIEKSALKDMDKELVEENKLREEGMPYYYNGGTIAPGGKLEAFVTFKMNKKQTSTSATLTLDGRTFTFDW